MTLTKKAVPLLLVLGMIFALTTSAAAQVINSGPQAIDLKASLAESLTLTLSGNAVNFTLTPGSPTNPGSTTITATTSWVLKAGRGAVTVNAFFTTAAALSDTVNGVNIPNTAFTITDNGGTPTALTGATPFSAFGYQMQNIAITGFNKNSSVTDNMAFNIDLSTGALPQLPAGEYQGTLTIQAQATP